MEHYYYDQLYLCSAVLYSPLHFMLVVGAPVGCRVPKFLSYHGGGESIIWISFEWWRRRQERWRGKLDRRTTGKSLLPRPWGAASQSPHKTKHHRKRCGTTDRQYSSMW